MKKLLLHGLIGLVGCAVPPRPVPVPPPPAPLPTAAAAAEAPVWTAEVVTPPPQDDAYAKAAARYLKTQRWTDIQRTTSVTYAFEPTKEYVLECPEWEVLTIRLLPGEVLRDVGAGNPVEWMVKSTSTGNPAAAVLMIRRAPYAPTIRLVAITDRNMYNFRLKPGAQSWTRSVSFYDPEAELKAYREHQAFQAAAAERQRNASAYRMPQLQAATLREYRITGDVVAWRPLWVRGDDAHTWVQLPPTSEGEQPILRVMTNGVAVPINYRTVPGLDGKGAVLVADQAWTEAQLIGRGGTITLLPDKGSEKRGHE
jgi:type IV secretory pathway VirB9-like protein